MREVMREGRTEARVDLAEVANASTVAVGALEGLSGEIAILDGTTWIARGDTRAMAAGTEPLRATLLTAADVGEWVSAAWTTGGDLPALEQAIAALLHRSLLEPGDTVPFLLEGRAQQLSLHVVRGFCPHAGEDPAREPVRYEAPAGARVRLVGFFAPQRAGELTHHGTALHVHALVDDPSGVVHLGHVDRATLESGSVLRVPGRS